jgi:hypothetical protein
MVTTLRPKIAWKHNIEMDFREIVSGLYFPGLRRIFVNQSRDNSVCIATGYGLDDRGSTPGRDKIIPRLHNVQTYSGAHPTSYKMGAGCSFSGGGG